MISRLNGLGASRIARFARPGFFIAILVGLGVSLRLSSPIAAEQPRHQRRHSFPALGFCKQLFAAGSRQRVELRLAIVIRGAPLGRNPSALFQAQQCRVERALIELEQIFRDLLNALRNAVAVQRS